MPKINDSKLTLNAMHFQVSKHTIKILFIMWRDSTDCSAAASYSVDPGSNLVVSTLLKRVISDHGIAVRVCLLQATSFRSFSDRRPVSLVSPVCRSPVSLVSSGNVFALF